MRVLKGDLAIDSLDPFTVWRSIDRKIKKDTANASLVPWVSGECMADIRTTLSQQDTNLLKLIRINAAYIYEFNDTSPNAIFSSGVLVVLSIVAGLIIAGAAALTPSTPTSAVTFTGRAFLYIVILAGILAFVFSRLSKSKTLARGRTRILQEVIDEVLSERT